MSSIEDVIDDESSIVDGIFSQYAARPKVLILLVEGPTDARTYKEIFPETNPIATDEVDAKLHGRQSVKNLISETEDEPWANRVYGIVDKDLDVDVEDGMLLERVLVTDYSDLEMYALLNPQFYTMLEEVLKINDAAAYSEKIDMCLRIAAPLGAFRRSAHVQKEPFAVSYGEFGYAKKGKKRLITNIELPSSVLLTETLGVLKRADSTLSVRLEKIAGVAKKVLEKHNPNLLVKSEVFADALIRVSAELKLVRSNQEMMGVEAVVQDARKYLKSNGNVVREDNLGKNILALV